MSEIRVKENESLESALKRFKRSCQKDGVIAEVKKREHYVSPSLKRKQKSEAARKTPVPPSQIAVVVGRRECPVGSNR